MTAALPPRAIIGMIHVQALPGSPKARLCVDDIVARAAAEARVLADAGFDAIIVENMHDRPYVHGGHGPETVAVMTRVALAVREHARRDGEPLPLGVQILSGGNREALAVALAAGAQFIRCENFVFAHVADEGLLERAEAGPLLRYRRQIGADHVKVLTDIQKKHACHAITADLTVEGWAEAAEFFGSDGLIVSGSATGKPTREDDILAAARGSRLPVFVGSGATAETVGALLRHAAGVIVGSWIKEDGVWYNPPDPARCRALVAAAAHHHSSRNASS
jgi:membrane complex biogenesis BtpA family protein